MNQPDPFSAPDPFAVPIDPSVPLEPPKVRRDPFAALPFERDPDRHCLLCPDCRGALLPGPEPLEYEVTVQPARPKQGFVAGLSVGMLCSRCGERWVLELSGPYGTIWLRHHDA